MDKNILLRSMLFVPAHVDKFFNKAIQSEADVLIFDLEDGVPADKKELARDSLRDKLGSNQLDYPLFVRTNARETGLLEKDLEAMIFPQINGFVFPKVRNAEDIVYFEKLLSEFEKQKNIPKGQFSILPLIETTEGVLNVFEIAKASDRIIALIFGHEDFLLDLQANHAVDSRNLLVPRMMVAMAARAVGAYPIDTPYLQMKDIEGCQKHVQESRVLGFSGMLVLHPSQIEIANDGYSPSKEEIEKAEKIVSLDREAKRKNRSIAFSDGKFTAPPILKQAELVLETSKRMKRRKNNGKN